MHFRIFGFSYWRDINFWRSHVALLSHVACVCASVGWVSLLALNGGFLSEQSSLNGPVSSIERTCHHNYSHSKTTQI
jgi:hypothetical protein